MFARKSRARLALGLFYGLLLLISLVVRAHRGSLEPLEPVESTADVLTVDGDRISGPRVRVAYQELTPDSGRDVETILLLHGSPGYKEELGRLASVLARDVRVVVPDLPGFGSSTRAVPDYSFRAHAHYVRQLLDHLGLRHVHVLGYSMGGGVALSLVDIAPERVASLTLVSAIGVQEMELTGDYYVNHFVHAAQLAALWVAREGIPHMGLLDRAMLGVPYARNFFDSDQRPLRGVLQRVSVPTLIVHGVDDGQVPIEAAREHYRLVPQSELLALPGDHFLVFTKAEGVGAAVTAFVHRVATGDATRRANADPERIRFASLAFGSVPLPRVRGIAATVFAGLLMVTALLSESFGSAAAANVRGARPRKLGGWGRQLFRRDVRHHPARKSRHAWWCPGHLPVISHVCGSNRFARWGGCLRQLDPLPSYPFQIHDFVRRPRPYGCDSGIRRESGSCYGD